MAFLMATTSVMDLKEAKEQKERKLEATETPWILASLRLGKLPLSRLHCTRNTGSLRDLLGRLVSFFSRLNAQARLWGVCFVCIYE
jgi:hypothetical protein